MTDLELLQAAARKDGRAFETLVHRHGPALLRLARCLVGHHSDAEDALQETFAGAFRAAGSFAGNSSVKTWLTGILIRQAIKIRSNRQKHRGIGSLGSAGMGEASIDNPAMGSSPTTGIELRIDVAAMLDRLPDEHREVMLLREVAGFSYEEIAEVLIVPKGTVESRLHRARATMRSKLRVYR